MTRFVILGSVLFLATSAWGSRTLGNSFVRENEVFEGKVTQKQEWEDHLCYSSYEYAGDIVGKVKDLDLDIQADGRILVVATLGDLVSNAEGNYASQYTLCRAVWGWVTAYAETAQIRGEIKFWDDEKGDTRVLVRVDQTDLANLRIKSSAPDWLEPHLAKTILYSLRKVWGTQLGKWLNGKLTEIVQEQFPPSPSSRMVVLSLASE